MNDLYGDIFGAFTEDDSQMSFGSDAYAVAELEVALLEHDVENIITSRQKLDDVADLFEQLIEDDTSDDKYAGVSRALSVGLNVQVEVDGDKSAKGVVAKIVDGVKLFIKKLVEAVKNIWGKMFDKLLASQDKLDKLTKDIKDVDNAKDVSSSKLDLSAYLAVKRTAKHLKDSLTMGVEIVKNIGQNGAKYYNNMLTAPTKKEFLKKFYNGIRHPISLGEIEKNLRIKQGIIYPASGNSIIIVGVYDNGYTVETKSYESETLLKHSVEVSKSQILEYVDMCPNKKELADIREEFYGITKDFLGKLDKEQESEEIAKAIKDYTTHTTKMMHGISKGLINSNKVITKSAKQWLDAQGKQEKAEDKTEDKTEE